jgi:hypothetical protein
VYLIEDSDSSSGLEPGRTLRFLIFHAKGERFQSAQKNTAFIKLLMFRVFTRLAASWHVSAVPGLRNRLFYLLSLH